MSSVNCVVCAACRRIVFRSMFDRARQHFRLRDAFSLAQERLDNEIDHVAHRQAAKKAPQQPEGLHRVMQQLVHEQPTQPCAADVVDDFAGQAGCIDLQALELRVPVAGPVQQSAVHILVPQGRITINGAG